MDKNSNAFHGRSKEVQTHSPVSSPSMDNMDVAEHSAQEEEMLNISVTTVDMKKPKEEEMDLHVLDPNHPLVLKHQRALTLELSKQLENLKFELNEKTKQKKDDARYSTQLSRELQREQENQIRMEKKLKDLNTVQAQTAAKHTQVQEQLEVNTNQNSKYSEKKCKAELSVSQLQAELDNLMLLSLYTKEDFDEVQSQLKTMKIVRHHDQAEQNQAEKEKKKQDLFVDSLTKELDSLSTQKDTHLGKIIALKEETRAYNKSLSQIKMDMEMFLMTRKQLLCQWNNRLVEMQKMDEPFSAKQDEVFKDRQLLVVLDEEIGKYNKAIKAIEEQNQTLITELKWYKTECAALKKRISEKQSKEKDLQSRYKKQEYMLERTSKYLAFLQKGIGTLQTELNNYSKEMDKISSIRHELENKIITHMEQLPHKHKDEHSLLKMTHSLKTEKQNQLQHQDSDINAIMLTIHNTNVLVGSLKLTQKDHEEEMRQLNKHLTIIRTDNMSRMKLNEQKQGTITEYKNKINKIVVAMANEDMGPLETKIHTLTGWINEVEKTISDDKQQWMKVQELAVGKMLKMEVFTREIFILQTENTAMQHKKMRLERQVEFENQTQKELEKTSMTLYRDRLKLRTLLNKNKISNQELEEKNELMETQLNMKLKEEYWETITLQMKNENIEEENEQIMANLMETEQHIMLWERKAQIVQETQAVVQSEENQEHMSMKADIHRKELQLSGLMKQQTEMVNQSEAVVEKWGSHIERKKSRPSNSSKTQATKTAILRLKCSIKEVQTLVDNSMTTIYKLQEDQTGLSDRLMQQKQQVTELTNTFSVLDSDISTLQQSKLGDSENLRILINREKKLQEAVDTRYRVFYSNDHLEEVLEKITNHLHKVGTISHCVYKEYPQHQEVLHRITLELAPHIKKDK